MSVRYTKEFNPSTGVETLHLEDGNGRKMDLQCSIFDFPDPMAFFQPHINQFSAQEEAINSYMQANGTNNSQG